MRLLKQALAGLGAFVVFAAIAALVAPQHAHAVAAALVQIVPGTTTHVGQDEGQLVSLKCELGKAFCQSLDSAGNLAAGAYEVPAGFTLVITDYGFEEFGLGSLTGQFACDAFFASTVNQNLSLLPIPSCAVVDTAGFVSSAKHFTTGIRAASGVSIGDQAAAFGDGDASIQGYLVPN